LRGLNTFGFDVPADCLTTLGDVRQLADMQQLPRPLRVLGGGSNVLLTGPVHGTVILNRLMGINVVAEDRAHVWVRAGAGEVWHDLVLYAISNSLGGIENLALIPGTVGAAPIQNIGAYGVEVRDTITGVEAWNWERGEIQEFSNEACRFGYRDSVFKHELKDRVVITAVTFRLSRRPELHLDYGAIREELAAMVATPSVQTVAQAVINIRRSKLPDPAVIGNAGSFFKNPAIPGAAFEALKAEFWAIPSFPAGEGLVKVPAGWLIEQCGWKGYRCGDAGVHAKQALVLVNYGSAAGEEILQLSADVMRSVKEKFGIMLEREVQVW
jgi:UDP-N-acetylmuramate dehydrogenase